MIPANNVFLPVLDSNEALDANKNKRVDLNSIGVGGGMTANEKTMFNRLVMRQAEDDYNNSLTALDYKGGFYDIFADQTKIASNSNTVISTLDGGDTKGKVELEQGGWDISTATFDGTPFSVTSQETTP